MKIITVKTPIMRIILILFQMLFICGIIGATPIITNVDVVKKAPAQKTEK